MKYFSKMLNSVAGSAADAILAIMGLPTTEVTVYSTNSHNNYAEHELIHYRFENDRHSSFSGYRRAK